MPKQFKNSKKILAATVLTTALSVAPIVSNAGMPSVDEYGNTHDEPIPETIPAYDPDHPSTQPELPAVEDVYEELPQLPQVYEDEHGNKVYDYSESNLDPEPHKTAEPVEGPVVSMPTVDEKGNTIYEGQYNKPSVNKVSTNKVSTNKVSKVSTNQNLNPKTGDSSMIGDRKSVV